MRRIAIATVGVALVSLVACKQEKPLKPGEGFINVPGGKVWYRIAGEGTATPLVLLHGGPGGSSLYLKPLEELADERPVIFYDQLGGGKSDRPKDQSLWRMDRFVDELQAVRDALNLHDVHLFGSSFGTMIVADYYLLRNPKGVHSIIMSSPPLSIPRWIQDSKALLHTLPPDAQVIIEQHEREGTTNTPEYQAAMQEYYGRYLSRRQPWSPDTVKTLADLNPDVYTYMQGPSEFTITGTLKNYDRTGSLGAMNVRTLFTAGRYDEVRPETLEYYKSLVPGAQKVIIDNAGHLTMQDQPEKFVAAVRAFLHDVEKK